MASKHKWTWVEKLCKHWSKEFSRRNGTEATHELIYYALYLLSSSWGRVAKKVDMNTVLFLFSCDWYRLAYILRTPGSFETALPEESYRSVLYLGSILEMHTVWWNTMRKSDHVGCIFQKILITLFLHWPLRVENSCLQDLILLVRT